MADRVDIAGVGMTPFHKPGKGPDYIAMATSALSDALADSGLNYRDIQQAYVGYVYGDSTAGQAALYPTDLTGIPIINVNNNCATGSSALFLARQAVASGAVECALALGFEQMSPGAIGNVFPDRPAPLGAFTDAVDAAHGASDAPMALKIFGGAAIEYVERYGAKPETFAKIAVKARRHAEHNERAIFRRQIAVEEVLASPALFGPMTRLQACPPTCGAAAVILVSEAFATKRGLAPAVTIRAQALTTDGPTTFGSGSMIKLVGTDIARAAAAKVYADAGIGPEDVDMVELHDCFTINEILSYEALGLVPEGGAERFVVDGDNSYGGRVVTNPSGGLLSKGHPLGATGLAQISELVWQLRGQAGARQVEGARIGLQHNLGLGGACVVSLLERI